MADGVRTALAFKSLAESGVHLREILDSIERRVCAYDLSSLCHGVVRLAHFAAWSGHNKWQATLFRMFTQPGIVSGRPLSSRSARSAIESVSLDPARFQMDEKGVSVLGPDGAEIYALKFSEIAYAYSSMGFVEEILEIDDVQYLWSFNFGECYDREVLEEVGRELQRRLYAVLSKDLQSKHYLTIGKQLRAFLDGRPVDDALILSYWRISRIEDSSFNFQTAARRMLYFRLACIEADIARGLSVPGEIDEHLVLGEPIEAESQIPVFARVSASPLKVALGVELDAIKLIFRIKLEADGRAESSGHGTCVFPEGFPVPGFERTAWRAYAFALADKGETTIPDLLAEVGQLSNKFHERRLAFAFAVYEAAPAKAALLLALTCDESELGVLDPTLNLTAALDKAENDVQLPQDIIAKWKRAFSNVNFKGLRKQDLDALKRSPNQLDDYLTAVVLCEEAERALTRFSKHLRHSWGDGSEYRMDIEAYREQCANVWSLRASG